MSKVRCLNKDVILGVVALIVLVVTGLFTFQLGRDRDTPDLTLTTDLSEIPRISVDELKHKVDIGSNLMIIDTRSKEAYERTHIAGSISIPLETVTERHTELKDFEEIFIYCT
ncbi:rhodanese-like domain-containing protein [Chloroflexota bacterium]